MGQIFYINQLHTPSFHIEFVKTESGFIVRLVDTGLGSCDFDSHNSLKLNFTNILGLCSIFVDCEFFLESNSPDILALCETKLNGLIGSGDFFVRGYLPLI